MKIFSIKVEIFENKTRGGGGLRSAMVVNVIVCCLDIFSAHIFVSLF